MVSVSSGSCCSRHFSARCVLCFEDFVGAAALGSVHGTKMEEIVLGVVCTKSTLAVFPVGSSSGSLCRRNAFGYFIIRKNTVKDTCLVLWVQLRSAVSSCVLGTLNVFRLSPLGRAVQLSVVTVEDVLLSWCF